MAAYHTHMTTHLTMEALAKPSVNSSVKPIGKSLSPLLAPSEDRLVLYPIQYPTLLDAAKKAIGCFWTVEELSFQQDIQDWASDKLEPAEKKFILDVLGFFAASDGVVVENLVTNFCAEVQLPEARYFYANQTFMEAIHGECYSLLLHHFAADLQQVKQVQESPAVKLKAKWAFDRFTLPDPDPNINFAKRLVAFACVEGIMFSASFCALFWLKSMGVCPALTFSNELISRDEGLHRDFAVLLYKTFFKLERQDVLEIVTSAVNVEQTWVKSTLPQRIRVINATDMCTYVEFVADHLLRALGFANHYNATCPFDFMHSINLSAKTNFFERRVSEYAKADATGEFNMDDDF